MNRIIDSLQFYHDINFTYKYSKLHNHQRKYQMKIHLW